MISQPKFKLGQKVCSKQTGYPAVGTVIGINFAMLEDVKCFGTRLARREPAWDKLYPNWTEKLIYVVLLEKPQPTATFEEWAATLEQRFGVKLPKDNPVVMANYVQDIPYKMMITFPEDDLESMED